MKILLSTILTLFLILFCITTSRGQSSACNDATPICSDESYEFPNAVNTSVPYGPNYGCLDDPNLMGMQNPLWYYMQINTEGVIQIDISQTSNYGSGLDLDFVLWGPFDNLQEGCQQVMGGVAPIQCSSSPLNTETIGIGTTGGSNYWYNMGVTWLTGQSTPPPAQSGEVYIILITNADNQLGTIHMSQTNTGEEGAGDTDCSILVPCLISTITASPANCDPITNTFSVSGTVTFEGAPDSGSLIIEDCNGHNLSYPVSSISSPFNYTIDDIPSDGSTCEVTAYFSEETTCSLTSSSYQNPEGCECVPPELTILDTTICSGENVDLTELIDNDEVTFTSSFYLTQTDAENKTNPISGIVTPSTDITYYVRAEINEQPNCYSIDPIQISILPVPSINAGQGATIDCNEYAALGGVPEPGFSYSWSPSGGLSANNISNPFAHPETTTTYTLTITDGQCTYTSQVVVEVEPLIYPTFPPLGPYCQGENFSLPSVSIEGVYGTWMPSINTDETTIYLFEPDFTECAIPVQVEIEILESTTSTFEQIDPICQGESLTMPTTSLEGISGTWSPSPDNTQTTIYTFNASPSEGCVEHIQMQVEILAGPDLSISGDLIIYDDIESTATLTVSGAETYYWSNGLGEGFIKEVSPEETTVYTIVGVNENGCMDSIHVRVEVYRNLVYFIPNSFTPDNDDFNEVFQPIFTKGYNPNSYSFYIYNRWGEILFESHDVDVGWNGYYQMNKTGACPNGVYIWKFRVKTVDTDAYVEKMGHVNLLR